MTFRIDTEWNNQNFRVAICFPTSDASLRPYGVSGIMGAVAGLHDSGTGSIAVKIVDTSGDDLREIVSRIERLDPRPHVCLGVIRSNLAAVLVRWCETYSVTFIGTDHSAARFYSGVGQLRRYFRTSCVADQLVRTCLHAFSFKYQAARRLLVIVSDYEYGRSIQEATLSLVANHPRWLSAGVVGVIEWPTSASAMDQRVYAKNELKNSLNAVKPDAVLLGIWGQSILVFGEVAQDYNVPLIVPDAGWDKASQAIQFPQHSVLGARYYVPPDPASDRFLRDVVDAARTAGSPELIEIEDIRYPVAASYDAALAVGRTVATLGEAGLLNKAFETVSTFFNNAFSQADVGMRANGLVQTGRFKELKRDEEKLTPKDRRLVNDGERRLINKEHPVAVAKRRAFTSDENQWTWLSEESLLQHFPEAPRRGAGSSANRIPNPVP